MGILRFFSLAIVSLVLVGCVKPGGIYKGYEGSFKYVDEVAILDWTTTEAKVTRIDGKKVQEKHPIWTGVEITIAHMSPGQHTVTILHGWKEINYRNSDSEELDLRAEFEPGQTYRIDQFPRYDLDPFEVTVSLVETASGAVIQEGTATGRFAFWEARRRGLESCKSGCNKWCGSYPEDEEEREEYWDCIEDEQDCEEDCECEWGDRKCDRSFKWFDW